MASTSRNASRRGNARNTQSQSQHTQSQILESTPMAIDNQVLTMINFILCHSANKVPIKFTDLTASVDNRNEAIKRLPLVSQLLEETYGIKLIQLDGAPKRYICVAEAPVASTAELTSSQQKHQALLYIILTYIFLRGNKIEDEKLYAMLTMMEIDVHEEHGYFGDDIFDVINDTFVNQQYLRRERSQLSPYDDPKTFFSWGPRAKCEITYQEIVKFASKLFNQDASFFQQQLMMAEGVDNPEMMETPNESIDNTESYNVTMDTDSQ
ncbi:non-structural maintenance of chromosomes element 3 homolog [Drosophila sulfurigaster albostrigata]|uniref:non-structural maintenance of chromosomes element 3 homolog n=1 Tax=Drosophila sulfurigaster albostrigata TaxID=89887 RepID=UPI002D21ABA9|nr:non-structural maintenance of chromosomes element 3 homolog [Drosophila sulfurigaster albostrigata]